MKGFEWLAIGHTPHRILTGRLHGHVRLHGYALGSGPRTLLTELWIHTVLVLHCTFRTCTFDWSFTAD